MKKKQMKDAYFRYGDLLIYNHDFLKVDLQEGVDLIVTSPPYGVNVRYESYDDSIPYDKYLEFARRWLSKCHFLSKPDGRMCLNLPIDKNKGGIQSVYADITNIAKKVGWKYHCSIIWNEQNISRRTAWGSWMSASAPFVIAPVEIIVVLYKNQWRKEKRGKSDISKEEFIQWTNGVWSFSGESKKKVGHPSPFPVELPIRCIKLFSYVGDLILDPFMGSGTSLIACLETKRKGVGIEINKKYCDLAIHRIKNHKIWQKTIDPWCI